MKQMISENVTEVLLIMTAMTFCLEVEECLWRVLDCG